jgi:hypothetical protein
LPRQTSADVEIVAFEPDVVFKIDRTGSGVVNESFIGATFKQLKEPTTGCGYTTNFLKLSL